MKKRIRRGISLFLTVLLMLGILPSAYADGNAENARVVIGADLTEEQIADVYARFGIERGSVPELILTNEEERSYLEGFAEASSMGSLSISCVYVQQREEGSGLEVTADNVTAYTPEMYRNALATMGISDAKIMVAAPFPVSGTAALAGVCKAYEDMTGSAISEEAIEVSTQELTVTGELAEEVGEEDAASLVNEIKLVLLQGSGMSDEQLGEEIRSLAKEHGMRLNEKQVEQLRELCRSIENLGDGSLLQRVQDIQDTIQKVSEAKDKVVGFIGTVRSILQAMGDFFAKLKSIFGKE